MTNEIIPSVGQGIICAQCKENDPNIIKLLNKINDPDTFKCAIAERNVLKILEGDCDTAVGAHAKISNNRIILEAELFSLDGSQRFYEKKDKEVKEFDKIGLEIGKNLKDKSKGSYKK